MASVVTIWELSRDLHMTWGRVLLLATSPHRHTLQVKDGLFESLGLSIKCPFH